SHVSSSLHSMKREVYRKLIHFMGVPLPFLAALNRDLIFFLLLGVIMVYSLSEGLRYMGFHFPVVSHVTRRARRLSEFRGFIMGPVSLTVGILASVILFPPRVYLPAVLIVCISDSLSGLVGRRFGAHVLPCWKRTLEGSAAFYLSAMAILLFFLPVGQALLLGLVPTVIELLSPHDLDNLFIPLGTALVLGVV
ncbi:MAG: diacylglycerol/polyprenol kinase family protein, partial [Spirochaetota bacterium]